MIGSFWAPHASRAAVGASLPEGSPIAAHTAKLTTQDRVHVDVRTPAEVVGWCNKWSVAPERLKAAIAEVGTSAAAVAKALGRPY